MQLIKIENLRKNSANKNRKSSKEKKEIATMIESKKREIGMKKKQLTHENTR